jgi:hypothetical protein
MKVIKLKKAKKKSGALRYGIGEWFGGVLSEMPRNRILKFAESSQLSKPDRPCPARSHGGVSVHCNKRGGVCTVRLYKKHNGYSIPADGRLVTLCPQRFWEDNLVFKEIGRSLLGQEESVLVKEVGFLLGERNDDVGRIDSVLVIPGSVPLRWCAVEIQAVYFSGRKMELEFESLRRKKRTNKIPFPIAQRRPDFRSSGPKRLMPQLQIKVPTLRRWGKKMAVVVDASFFDSMGKMESSKDVSNADILWFIMDYRFQDNIARLFLSDVFCTTLEMAITGLTAGSPVTLPQFEEDIKKRIPMGISVA